MPIKSLDPDYSRIMTEIASFGFIVIGACDFHSLVALFYPSFSSRFPFVFLPISLHFCSQCSFILGLIFGDKRLAFIFASISLHFPVISMQNVG